MRNQTTTTGRVRSPFGIFRIALTLLATVILIALAGIACGDAEEGPDTSNEPAATADADEHVDDADEHVDDADEHVDGADDQADDADAHTDDADAHVDDADAHTDGDDDHADDSDSQTDDADAHTDGDDHDADSHDDPEANAYLEAAAKEALFLVDMSLFSYAPSVLEVEAGEVIEIAIQNSEAVLHDFTIDKIDADVHISYLGGTGQHVHEEAAKDADVHFALTEPASGIVHLKIHEPGEYVFYCSVPGHQELGMEGTLTVTEG